MTAAEIKSEIDAVCRSDWAMELAPLADRLRRADRTETFHALFQFAVHSQNLGPAAPAAWLLRQVNPPCPISCREATQKLLHDWDVSIEEVPFYLAEQFGVPAVRETVAGLRTTCTESVQVTLLDTIDYWLCCYAESQEYKRQHGAD